MNEQADKLFERAMAECGAESVAATLQSLISDKENGVLTIVCNSSLHPLRAAHVRGEVFTASQGVLDFSSAEAAKRELENVLIRVNFKLHEKPWRRIYLVPFGPSVLAMQIKFLVYRTLHIETVDVLHAGDDRYYDIKIQYRGLMSKRYD